MKWRTPELFAYVGADSPSVVSTDEHNRSFHNCRKVQTRMEISLEPEKQY